MHKGDTSLCTNVPTSPGLQNVACHPVTVTGGSRTCKVYPVAEFGGGERNGAASVGSEAFLDVFAAHGALGVGIQLEDKPDSFVYQLFTLTAWAPGWGRGHRDRLGGTVTCPSPQHTGRITAKPAVKTAQAFPAKKPQPLGPLPLLGVLLSITTITLPTWLRRSLGQVALSVKKCCGAQVRVSASPASRCGTLDGRHQLS